MGYAAKGKMKNYIYIARVSYELQMRGYTIDCHPKIPGVKAMLYSRSSKRFWLEFAKVEDHFLFVDWDRSVSGLDQLKEIYQSFSAYANLGFQTPHGLRMQIPNLAVIAISQAEFPDEVLSYARETNLTPWYGGEVGQIILIEVGNKKVTAFEAFGTGRYRPAGTYELIHAANLIREMTEGAFASWQAKKDDHHRGKKRSQTDA